MIHRSRVRKLLVVTSALFILFVSPCLLITADARGKRSKASHRGRSAKDARPRKSRTRADRKVVSKRQRGESRRAARRRAEAARLAAIARQRAIDEALRNRVQELIANDDLSGEDSEVRRVVVEALGQRAGTVVVMDAQTGRIYSIVNQEWALREGFKPCSTIKLVTGLAGLSESVIDPSNNETASTHTGVELTKALAYSNNEYFQQVGGQVGFDKLVAYARLLGLGERTGINAQNEFAGRLPVLKSGFALNRMSSHGDDFEVTAVQLATLVSAMGNGGKLLTPYIARTTQDEVKLPNRVRWRIDIDPDMWRYMVPGMVGAVNYGSGRRAYDPAQTVAGKTGTCIEDGKWVGLFTSYAPLANPRLAVVVIARGSDARSHHPAAIAGRIYRELNGRFGTATGLQLANSNPTEADLATEDETTSDAETNEAKGARKPWWGNSKIRRVLMPIPKKSEKNVTAPTPTPSSSEVQKRPRRVVSQNLQGTTPR
jgi:membrane peptidoglycan carboxypeptidase